MNFRAAILATFKTGTQSIAAILRPLIVRQATGKAMMRHTNDSRPNGPETKPARPSLLARFVGNRKGTTVIEFAVLAIPFALLVFAILESCISFAAQQLLMNVTDEVARQVRTGQLKATDLTDVKLRELICAKLSIMVGDSCNDPNNHYLAFDLETYSTFAAAAQVRTKKTADNDLDETDFGVHPGGPLTKNMLRVYYKWPVMTDFMARTMSDLKGGRKLLFATVTWQNEPF
jgi:Flp pilus assembly protein TadG